METKGNLTENFRQGSHWITGMVQDVLIDKQGNRTYLPVDHNLVVNSCSTLIAAFMKGDDVAGPLKYWAIGGVPSGESGSASEFGQPSGEQTKLYNEFFRQEITSDNISYVAADNQTPSTVPTNKLKISIVVPYGSANGTWYEFGLFGGSQASEASNSGIMINRKVHDPITKSSNLQVERNIIFTF